MMHLEVLVLGMLVQMLDGEIHFYFVILILKWT